MDLVFLPVVNTYYLVSVSHSFFMAMHNSKRSLFRYSRYFGSYKRIGNRLYVVFMLEKFMLRSSLEGPWQEGGPGPHPWKTVIRLAFGTLATCKAVSRKLRPWTVAVSLGRPRAARRLRPLGPPSSAHGRTVTVKSTPFGRGAHTA